MRAGRRFAVRRFESGNKTSTTSPRLKGIVSPHLRALPTLREGSQARAQVRGLRFAPPAPLKVYLASRQERHHDARPRNVGRRPQQFSLAVAADASDCLRHGFVSHAFTVVRSRGGNYILTAGKFERSLSICRFIKAHISVDEEERFGRSRRLQHEPKFTLLVFRPHHLFRRGDG